MTQLFVKNYDELMFDDLPENNKTLRAIGLKSLEKAISSVKPKKLIENSVSIINSYLCVNDDIFNLNNYDKVYIIGGGKASAEMAIALENKFVQIPGLNCQGIINIPHSLKNYNEYNPENIQLNFASHPNPDKNGLHGTRAMIELIKNTTKDTLIIILISGGGSALLPFPKRGISLTDLKKINSLLLASGANIHEINAIRKHISDFKGGNLAKKLWNSNQPTVITLIISDVVGNDLDSIASGPTAPDSTTYRDAYNVLKKYSLIKKAPRSVVNILKKGIDNPQLENPKKNNECFSNVHNYLIGSVESAVLEIEKYLNSQNFRVLYFSNKIEGEAKEYGKTLHRIILKKIDEDNTHSKRLALIGTGELTVKVKGNGIGGRNQEMLLSLLGFIKNNPLDFNFLVFAVNLDGIEGNSKAMGALIDNYTLNQVRLKKINIEQFLNENNSNQAFKLLKTEIVTGPTGCNVNDLILILISR